MADIVVKYNGTTLSPTPLVQQSYKFLDYGQRWGNVFEIELQGFVTGLTSSGSINSLINVFTGQFGTLSVFEGNNQIYSWNNLNIETLAFPENRYYVNSFVPYSVKMHQYNVPSGVLEPVNEYSFVQADDGTVNLTHKMGARGVKNNLAAFTNAVNFIKSISGRNNFQAAFIPSGLGVTSSISEVVNRAEGSYYLTEVYRYTTGVNQPYLTWFTNNIVDNLDGEYLTLETELKIQGSAVNNNLLQIESTLPSLDTTLSKLNGMGIATGNLLVSSMSIVRDSGDSSISIKRNFLSGYSQTDLLGFFDYTVSIDKDMVTPKESWKVDGQFVCKGPLDYKLTRLSAFKSSYSSLPIYLSGLITSSPVYSGFHNFTILPASNYEVEQKENTGMAMFQASLTLIEGAWPSGVENPRYSVEVNPSIWGFDLLPSANIEGHYVVQDLQMATKAHMNFNVGCETLTPTVALPILSGYMASLENIYVNTGSALRQTINTGLFDASNSKEWVGTDNISTGILNTKVVNSIVSNYIRQAGYKFGY